MCTDNFPNCHYCKQLHLSMVQIHHTGALIKKKTFFKLNLKSLNYFLVNYGSHTPRPYIHSRTNKSSHRCYRLSMLRHFYRAMIKCRVTLIFLGLNKIIFKTLALFQRLNHTYAFHNPLPYIHLRIRTNSYPCYR